MLNIRHKLDNIEIDNCCYSVTTVVANREPVFGTEKYARTVCHALTRGMIDLDYFLLAYVVMPNHVHAIIKPREKSLSESVRMFKGFSARVINAERQAQGKLWQKGFLARPIVDEKLLVTEIGYIENNPVKAGLAMEAFDYPYSSSSTINAISHIV